MKLFLPLFLFFIYCPGYAQDSTTRHMLHVYEDNDIIKLWGKMSDKGYTNGTRVNYFYTRPDTPAFFLSRWMPKAGSDAVNTFGWGITQNMFTPENIRTTEPDKADWPYSGALYISHSLHSANAVKGYNIQTEVLAGVMGKASLVEPMQKFIHRHTDSPYPMGWDKQYPTDVLLNLNFAIEKLIFRYKKFIDISGGASAMAGTMADGIAAYGLFRFGIMTPYYSGYISQYNTPFHNRHHKLQAYLLIRPSLEWIGYNAVLEGGILNGKSDYYQDGTTNVNHSISRRLDITAVLAYGTISCSFTQRIMPSLVDGFGHQRLGNVSLYVGW